MKKRIPVNFLNSLGNVLCITSFSDYIYPQKGDFIKDKDQINEDALVFYKDLNSVTDKAFLAYRNNQQR